MGPGSSKSRRARLADPWLARTPLVLSLALLLSCADSGPEGFTYSVVLAEVGLVANAGADGSVVGLNLDGLFGR